MKKSVIHPKITRAELGAVVCSALSRDLDDHPTLVGGAVAAIYSEGRYLSNDLDIVTYRLNRQIRPVMEKLGFVERGAHWAHPDTELFVQFVSSPVMIGRKHVKVPKRMRTAAGELPILSALDSACDRLAWFMEGDAQGIEQCADIVVAQRVSVAAIGKWLEGEPWPVERNQSALASLRRKIALRRKRARLGG